MALLAIPNVSEGRDRGFISAAAGAVGAAGARVLDVHTDAAHHRSVFTLAGKDEDLIRATAALARACLALDLTTHQGSHPRLGVLDVCPFVPHEAGMEEAVSCARAAASAIAEQAGLPVYLYGQAAEQPRFRELPEIRRLGLAGLQDVPPDRGPSEIAPRHGVVCVGARPPLVAFNVWLRTPVERAREIAALVRSSSGGPPGIRALGMGTGDPALSQVSMNLVEPGTTGVDRAFEAVAGAARSRGIEVAATELVGLPPQRFLPDPGREAARLLLVPGRSLESALEG